jgi:hypothetical protein
LHPVEGGGELISFSDSTAPVWPISLPTVMKTCLVVVASDLVGVVVAVELLLPLLIEMLQ